MVKIQGKREIIDYDYFKKISPVELSYIAAIIDWGYVISCTYTITKTRSGKDQYNWNVGLSIRTSGNDYKIAKIITEILGEEFKPKFIKNKDLTNADKKTMKTSNIINVIFMGKRLDALLEIIVPYVRLCKEELTTLIAFRKTFKEHYNSFHQLPLYIHNKRVEIAKKLKSMSRRERNKKLKDI